MLAVSGAVIAYGTVSGFTYMTVTYILTSDGSKWTVVTGVHKHQTDNGWVGVGCVLPLNKAECVPF